MVIAKEIGNMPQKSASPCGRLYTTVYVYVCVFIYIYG